MFFEDFSILEVPRVCPFFLVVHVHVSMGFQTSQSFHHQDVAKSGLLGAFLIKMLGLVGGPQQCARCFCLFYVFFCVTV